MAVCAAVATEDVAGKRLGEVLAEAMAVSGAVHQVTQELGRSRWLLLLQSVVAMIVAGCGRATSYILGEQPVCELELAR